MLLLAGSIPLLAQEERPQINPGERRSTRKKDAGPRALGVVQLSPNGKASLIPIAILIDGKFWDATAYKADPVPMSLDSGVVYEGERAGSSLGLFTVASALHSNRPNAPTPWLGTGAWRPTGSELTSTPAKGDTAPVGIEDADAPPRLTRDPNAVKQPAGSSSNPTSTNAPANPSPKPTTSSSDDGPPRLNKGSSTSPASEQPAQPPAASQPTPESKTSDAKAKSDAQPKAPASDSGATQGDRPVLRRGRPAESFADEDVPGYSKPGAAGSSSKADKVAETAAAANTDVQLIPAISDASGPIPHSFKFEWVKGDEPDRRAQLMTIAKDQLHAYLATQAKNRIAPKPSRPTATRRAPKPPEPIFENVQMVAYDLWNSNQPVVVFSAEAHLPPPPEGVAHSEIDSETQYSVLLVAYPDIYNNIHKLYSGVTDKFHLDVTPRLDLIDAVDADGDGRGELLFRKTSDSGTGWVVYRASADKLWKMYDSLNPQ
jgi:hypothetical protein